MRRTIVLALVLALAVAAGASATDIGIGAEYMFYTSGLSHNALLSLRAWPAPFQLGLGATFGSAPSFSITGDWWLKAGGISGSPLGYYVAVGGFVTLPDFTFGVRIPLGLQLWLIGDLLELFIEAVPYAGLDLTPSTVGIYGVGLGAGFRFWF
jgi:hypothetical protein